MGVEHPFLALMSFMIFSAMVISIVSVSVWIEFQVRALPIVEGYISYKQEGETGTLTITLRLVKGGILNLNKILILTEQGVAEVNTTTNEVYGATVRVTMVSFNGTLKPGMEGKMIISFTPATNLFLQDKEYGVVVLFDEYSVPMTFVPHN